MTDSTTGDTETAPARQWEPYPAPGDPGEHTVVGTVRRLAGVESPQLGNRRDLLVHLPRSYGSGERRYPVVYMHDGQNLFDRATSFADEWHVDGTMESLAPQGVEALVVAVPNTGETRLDEYSPWVEPGQGGGRGDQYLAFLAETVKPLVDHDFRTLPGPGHTGLVGSSMGGLISLYGFFRRPDVFGFAGVMSPALWFAGRAALDFVAGAQRVPGRIYLDVGTREGARTLGHARTLRGLLRARGYLPGRDLMYVEEPGAQHHEPAWGRRLRNALPFLLGHGA